MFGRYRDQGSADDGAEADGGALADDGALADGRFSRTRQATRDLLAAELTAARAFVASIDACHELYQAASVDHRELYAATRHLEQLRSARQRVDERDLASAELAQVLMVHPRTAEARLAQWQRLDDTPLLRALLESGRLTVPAFLAADAELSALGVAVLPGADPEIGPRLADEVVDQLLGRRDAQGELLGWSDTPARLSQAIVRTSFRLDPQGCAERRREATRRSTGVRLRSLSDGLAQLAATGSSPALSAAKELLEQLARPTGPEDERSHGQRQVDALLQALVARVGGGVDLELDLEVPVVVCETRDVPQDHGPDLAEPVTLRTQLTPELLTLLLEDVGSDRTDDEPHPDACSHRDEADRWDETVRRDEVVHEDETVRQDVTGVAGPPTVAREQHEDSSPVPTGGSSAVPRPAVATSTSLGRQDLDGASRFDTPSFGTPPIDTPSFDTPPIDTPPFDAPHVGTPASAQRSEHGPDALVGSTDPPDGDRAGADPPPESFGQRRQAPPAARRGALTEVLGLGPVDPQLLVELLGDPAGLPVGLSRVTVRRLCVDDDGQVVAVDTSAVPLHRLVARAATGPGGTTAADLLRALTDDLPAPPPPVDTYRPSAAQRRLAGFATPTCRFAGCRQRRCDLDHRVAHPRGETTTANLQPLCRRDHRLKHGGWRCMQHPDGSTTWTSPAGLSRTTRPG